MGAFQSVDEDALYKAACWLKKEDLLRLRELSPQGRDAARRAIATRAIPDIRLVFFGYQQHVPESALEMRAPPGPSKRWRGCLEPAAYGSELVAHQRSRLPLCLIL